MLMPSRSKATSTRYFVLASKMADRQRYSDFQPFTEWTRDAKGHALRIYLPGFRKNEFRVQAARGGKLTLKGRRSLGDGKFLHLEQAFAVPKDSDIYEISGKFDGGCLSLFMPRSEELFQEEVSEAGDEEVKTRKPEDQPESSARKEEEPIQKEKAKDREEAKPATPVYEEKPLTDEKEEEHLIQDEPTGKEKPLTDEKEEKHLIHDEPIGKEKPLTDEKEEEHLIQDEPIGKAKPLTDEKEEEHLIQDEPIPKKQPMRSTVSDDRFEKYKTKGLAWKGRIEEEVEWWLDYGLIDGFLETVNKNKKVIAVAVAAFCAGFYVSQKLRSSGR